MTTLEELIIIAERLEVGLNSYLSLHPNADIDECMQDLMQELYAEKEEK